MTKLEHRIAAVVVLFFIFCLSTQFISVYIGNDKLDIPKWYRPFTYRRKSVFEKNRQNMTVTSSSDAFSTRQDCKLRGVKLSPTPLPMTGLVSFPGSGNTSTRHLIQQMTGIGTSSVYCDQYLQTHGFLYECHKEFNKTVIVKMHTSQHFPLFKKIILLIRNPYDAMLAWHNMKSGGHTGHASKKELKEIVAVQFDLDLNRYIQLIENTTHTFKGPVYVLQYEKLKTDLLTEIKKLAIFLGQDVNETAIKCTVEQQEGNFHRITSESEHLQTLRETYTAAQLKRLHKAAQIAEKMLKDTYGLDIDVGGDVLLKS